jgi:A/G-specific adenine glycosylase
MNSLVGALLTHFDAHRRPMPWRETSDPYAIWVSEVMLQQTRVDTVRPYFQRWLTRFPDVGSLADAPVDEVLRHWQGLGYYGRARNLHRAALLVRERHGGQLPRDPDGLRQLPGVGEYTAGAVASIAFGLPTPAVDGNVRRVLARLRGLEDPAPRALKELVATLIPRERPGDFNQALMELGATLCTPRSPDCGACPVRDWCAARTTGRPESFPRPKRRGPAPAASVETRVVRRADGRVLLVQRPADGFLGGMWEFPGEVIPPWLPRLVSGARTRIALDPVVQAYSHKSITYRPTLYDVDEPPGPAAAGDNGGVPAVAWSGLDRLDAYALPVAQQRIASLARARPRPA